MLLTAINMMVNGVS